MQDDLQAMQKALTMQAQGTKSKTPIKTPPYNKQRRKNSMPSNSVGQFFNVKQQKDKFEEVNLPFFYFGGPGPTAEEESFSKDFVSMQQLNQLYEKDSCGQKNSANASANAIEAQDQPADLLQNNTDHMLSSNTKEETNSNAMTNSDKVRQNKESPEEEDEEPTEGIVQQNFKCSIEIKNGLPVRSAQNVIKNQNSLILNNYNSLWGLAIFLHETLVQFDHLILLVHILAQAVSGHRETADYSHVILIFIISLCVSGILNLKHDSKLREAASSVNNKVIEKFMVSKKRKCFQASNWGSIQTGDIFKVKSNIEIPCDALILNIVGSKGEFQTCYQKGSLWDDTKIPTLKRSYQGTMNKTSSQVNDAKFFESISGLIKWEYTHAGYFTGDFKQIDNPAAFELQPSNIVQRGCYALNCQFMIALALNVGPQTMGNGFHSPDKFQSRIRRSLLSKKSLTRAEGVHFRALRTIQLFSILYCLLPCILVLFEDFALKNTSMGKFANIFINLIPKNGTDKLSIMFDVMAGFMFNLPYLSHLTMECVVYFHTLFVLWDINLVPANIKFTNLRAMKTLGQVDTIISGKAAFLNENSRHVAVFQVGDQICYNNVLQSHSSKQKSNDDGHTENSVSSTIDVHESADDDIYGDALEYLPNQVNSVRGFTNPDAPQMLDQSHANHEQFKEFMTVLTICHYATSAKSHQINKLTGAFCQSYKSVFKEEESQLELADAYGFQFKNRQNKMLTIQRQGNLKRYEEIMLQKFKVQNEWITVQVVQPFQTAAKNATIYYKANLRLILQFLPKHYHKQLKYKIKQYCKEGIHSVGIAKRECQPEEANEIIHILQDLNSQKGSEDKKEAYLMSLAINLEIIGMLGMKTQCNTRDALLVEELRNNGVRLFMLSGEAASDNITDLNALKIFKDYRQPLNVTGSTDRQVEESIKNCLKQIVERREADPSEEVNQEEFASMNQIAKNQAQKKEQLGRNSSFQDKYSQSQNKELPTNRERQTRKKKENNLSLDEKNDIFINGRALQFILKDDTLTKLFLTLCSFCSLVIGSSITPYQKRTITQAITQYNIQGNQGYVISVIASQFDKFTCQDADASIGISKYQQQSDLLAYSDVQMQDVYGISYLLFKHGTVMHRRVGVVLNEFLYRTVLLSFVQLFFFTMSGFSTVLPYNPFFFTAFSTILSPLQYYFEGIMHMDYGYGIFHRIFGEYKFNQRYSLNFFDFSGVMITAAIDGCVYCIFYLAQSFFYKQDLLVCRDGLNLAWQSSILMNSVILSLFQLSRYRIVKYQAKMFVMINIFLCLVSISFIAEDDHHMGLQLIINSPNQLGILLFFLMFIYWKQQLFLFFNFFKESKRENVKRLQIIEDRLYMEEYEDPHQQFWIQQAVDFKDLSRKLEDSKLFCINQNLLAVHRNDSTDQILERINISGGQNKDNRSNFTNKSLINKFNLKLHDINKEIEYNQVSISDAQIKNYVVLIWTSTILYVIVGIFKVCNSLFLDSYQSSTTYRSDTAASTMQTLYFEVMEALVSLSAIYLISKIKSIRSDFVIFGLIAMFNLFVNIYFYIDPKNPLIQIQFLYTIAFSHLVRLNSVFYVSIVCLASAIGFLNIRVSTIQAYNLSHQEYSSIQLVWQALAVAFYCFFWTYYTYQDEIKQKVLFVCELRHIKELQKLRSIINILIPTLVRTKIQDGQKNFSESQGEVTVIFIDIEGFDRLTQQYDGRELIELLDRIYNAFDSLGEQYGLQKIETIGKTYMACGGLKVVEKDIDNRLLCSHHCVRVTDFACSVLTYVATQSLRNGMKLQVKVGIHTGEVIAGVVGETKPQFSLIGPTINKTARVCAKCPPNQILASKELQKILQTAATNFVFRSIKAEMKGIGIEELFVIQRRRRQNKPQKIIQKSTEQFQYKRKNQISEQSNNQLVRGQGNAEETRGGIFKGSNCKYDIEGQIIEQNGSERSGGEDSKAISEQLSSLADDTEGEQRSLDDSFDGDDMAGNVLKNNELKDDKQIVKSAAQNDTYNLVERPRFLFAFELKDQEQAFLSQQLKENYSQEVFQLISKAIIDLIIIEFLAYTFFGNDNIYIQISLLLAQALLYFAIIYFMRKLSTKSIMCFLIIQIIGIGFSMLIFILNGPGFQNFLMRSAQEVTLSIYQAIIIISRTIPFRYFFAIQFILYMAMIYQNFFFIAQNEINLQTYIIDSVLQLILSILLILASHTREMKTRREYNQQRIIEVEVQKTEELLGKLVPLHVLAGIKNDQRVVDCLDNVTLLYTDMVGFTEFSKNTQPQDVVTLLSRLFSKFDQLCEQYGVYKVHTIGDCYVIMSYTGKIPKERRSQIIQIEEAFRVTQVGFDMINIINEERARTKNPVLKNLNMRIGIHTGKIVGGIIGTKVVRYDIFGEDVLIANKMESNGIAGKVCISSQTYKLIHKNQFVVNTFNFEEHKECEIDSIGRTIMAYKVERTHEIKSISEMRSEEGSSEKNNEENKNADPNMNVNIPVNVPFKQSSKLRQKESQLLRES